jgi:hypothetical protein
MSLDLQVSTLATAARAPGRDPMCPFTPIADRGPTGKNDPEIGRQHKANGLGAPEHYGRAPKTAP